MVGRAEDRAWLRSTVWAVLAGQATARGDEEALVGVDTDGNDTRATYSEWAHVATALSAGLARIGVRRGDRFAIQMTNRVEWLYTYLAALRIGATVVPISTWLKDDEVGYILGKAKVRHLVLMDRFRRIDFLEMLGRLCPTWPASSPGGLHSAHFPALRNVVVWSKSDGEPPPGAFSWQELAGEDAGENVRLAEAERAAVRPDDLALIKFTSGSTGFPKGALLEQWGLVTNARLHARRLQLRPADRWFSAMPFFHAGGSVWGLMSMLVTGGTLVFTEAFDGRVAVEVMDRERCTANFAVPPMLRDEVDVLKAEGRTLTTLRYGHGGNPGLSEEVREWMGSELIMGPYGLTEGYGPLTINSPDDPPEKKDTGGRFFDGVEYRVVDPDSGVDLEPGEVGECLVRGLVMRGYHDEPERTAEAIDADGWLHTQDLISVDNEGYVTYVGRIKAMLKVGGENVAVEEVENRIRRFPGVSECCVIGIPDRRKQEIGRAYVVADPDLNTEALRAWCLEHLARFKVPRDFVVVPSLPMTGSTKVDRAAVIANDPEASALEHRQA
jgi:fatty-acyl-CoA synthase